MAPPRSKHDKLPRPIPSQGSYTALRINAATPSVQQSDNDDDSSKEATDHNGSGSTRGTTDSSRPMPSQDHSTSNAPLIAISSASDSNSETVNLNGAGKETENREEEEVAAKGDGATGTAEEKREVFKALGLATSTEAEDSKNDAHTELNAAGAETANKEEVAPAICQSGTNLSSGSGSKNQTHEQKSNVNEKVIDDDGVTWTTGEERKLKKELGLSVSTENEDSKSDAHTVLNAAGKETENQEGVAPALCQSETVVLRGSGSGIRIHEQQPNVDEKEPNPALTKEEKRKICKGLSISTSDDSDSKGDDGCTSKMRRLDSSDGSNKN